MAKREEPTLPLLNEMMRTHDFQRLLDLARPVLGVPLLLSNVTRTVLAITDEPEITDPRWLEIVHARGLPMGLIGYTDLHKAFRQSLETRRPVLTPARGEGDIPTLRKCLGVGDRILGYLDAPLYGRQPEEVDMEFFDFVGNLITLELQKDFSRATLPDNMMDYFVYDLLEGNLADQRLIQERLDYFGWNLLGKGKVQVVSIQGRESRLIPDNTRSRRLLEQFTASFPVFKTFIYGDQIKMLCPVKDALQQDEFFCRDLDALLSQEGLVAGLSRPLIHLGDIPDFNRQAERSVALGRLLHPERNLHFYDSYAIFHALELASREENILQFCHSAVILLQDYDRAHETDLLASLRVYLTHNRSIGESAAALYIHRNTMNYRVARIGELTGLDLDDPDVLCHLLFSFYVLDYRSAVNPPPERQAPNRS